jgi:hypothetical protein
MGITTYQIFVQQDGHYGEAHSQRGSMVRTATGFATVMDANTWIEDDAKLPNTDDPFRECDLMNSRRH